MFLVRALLTGTLTLGAVALSAHPASAVEPCDAVHVASYCDVGWRLNAGEQLLPGQSMISSNGWYRAWMQTDGNFVVYRPGRVAVWATHTAPSTGTYAEMQVDGNFVLYSPQRVPLWASHTAGNPGAYIEMQTDCNLVIYRPGRIAIWASHTAGC